MRYTLLLSLLVFATSIFAQSKLIKQQDESSLAIGLAEAETPLFVLDIGGEFLEAYKAEVKTKYSRGSFKFKEKKGKKCAATIQTIQEENNSVTIRGLLCAASFELRFTQADAHSVYLEISTTEDFNRIQFSYKAKEDEAVYGLGEQYSHVNLKGHEVPIWVEEQGLGRGDQPLTMLANTQLAGGDNYTSYAPMPFYLSSDDKALLLENTTRSIFNFKKKNKTSIEVWENTLRLRAWQAKTPQKLVELYTAHTGRLPLLPDWAYGTIAGLQGGTAVVPDRVDALLEAETPLTAIWIQDWCGQRITPFGSQLRWYWEADQERYKDFKNFCSGMNEKGVAVLGYISSFLTDNGPIFDEAVAKNYLVKNQAGENYKLRATGFDTYLIDFTNPDAYAWIKQLIKTNMIEMGLSGWMADFGEWLPWDAVLHSGISAEEYHNQYPVDWVKINREAIQESGKEGEIAFFSRTAYTGSNEYTTFYWAGDQMVYWKKHDGLPSAVAAMVSSGISGMSINHSDVGGFASADRFYLKIKRSRELLQRWIEIGAFSPINRTHECLLPKSNLQVYSDQEILAFYARFGRIHYALKPYLQHYVKEASETGMPVARHLYLHYPEDKEVRDLQYQYLLGEDLLVIPVIKKGKEKVKGYLPKGEWIHYFTKEEFKGGQWYDLAAPVGQPAVFIKKDSEWKDLLLQKTK